MRDFYGVAIFFKTTLKFFLKMMVAFLLINLNYYEGRVVDKEESKL